ncbi:MAG: hypothetical protein IPJ06_12065 [Saprospiraceae bacterium]|nr:hypothetical protein [Saprospiraceae bacterium]
MQRLFQIEELVMDKIHYLGLLKDAETRQLYKIMIIRSIGHGRIRQHFPLLDRFLQDEELQIRLEVLLAMGDSEETAFIPVLTGYLLAKETRHTAKQALIQFGPALLPHLEAIASHNIYPTELLRLLPSLAENIHSPLSVNYLFSMVRHTDVSVRLAALQSLHSLKRNFPDLHVSEKETIRLIIQETNLYKDTLGHLYSQKQLKDQDKRSAQEARQALTSLLERRLDGTLERIFHLLGLRYSPGQINTVYEGIKAENPDVRFNAIEFLDNILEPDLKKILIPIIESAVIDPASATAINQLNLTVLTEAECFDQLLNGRDEKVKLAVMHVMIESGDAIHRSRLASLLHSPNSRIKKAAQEGLDLLPGREGGRL